MQAKIFSAYLNDRSVSGFCFREGHKSATLFNLHRDINNCSEFTEMLFQEVFGDRFARHEDCVASLWLVLLSDIRFLIAFLLLLELLIQERDWTVAAIVSKDKLWTLCKYCSTHPSVLSPATGKGDLADRLSSSSVEVAVENGWYEAGSGCGFLRSCPFGRLNWTCWDSGFEILMFPDLMSFRATSRASRASFGRLGIGFSGSGLVFSACSCFF